MNKFLILTILTQFTIQKCEDYCVKCNEEEKCLFCDYTKNYFLTYLNTCVEKKWDNCKEFNLEGDCSFCLEGYYMLNSSRSCIKLEESEIVENCLYHSGTKSCSMCKQGYYLQQPNLCSVLNTNDNHTNCFEVNNDGLCVKCESNYYRQMSDLKKCNKLENSEQIENCFGYNQLQCDECLDEYVKYENNYIESLYSFDSISEMQVVFQIYKDQYNKIIDQDYVNKCKRIEVQDCEEYESFNKCKKCKDQFFLNNQKQCEAFPIPKIEGCVVYEDAQKCTQCSSEYILNSNHKCINFEKIDKCLEHDNTKTFAFCISCEEGYYADQNTSCVQRTNNSLFEDCQEQNPTQDLCQKCGSGKKLTSDFKKCLNEIVNCEEYQNSDSDTTQLECIKCQNKYFYNQQDKNCLEGTIQNCLIYENFQNNCKECLPKYYLDQGQCIQQKTLEGCNTYSQTEPKQCEDCDDTSIRFLLKNACLGVVTPIQKCIKYETEDKCEECELDYRLSDSKQCVEINIQQNCRKTNPNESLQCLQCNYEYFINSNNECEVPDKILIEQCQKHNITGEIQQSQIKCEYCRENAIPLDYSGNYTCKSVKLIAKTDQVDNCMKYKKLPNSEKYQCEYCREGYFKQVDSNDSNKNQCVTACGEDEQLQQFQIRATKKTDSANNMFEHYFVVENKQRCYKKNGNNDPNFVENCAVTSPNLAQVINDNESEVVFQQTCIQCKDSGDANNPIFSVVEEKKFVITDNFDYPIGQSEVSFYPGLKCVFKIENTYTQVKHASDCKYYYDTGSSGQNKYKCLSCKYGTQGIFDEVEDHIKQCNSFSECELNNIVAKEGIIYKSNQLTRLQTSWNSYLSCFKCKTGIPFVFLFLGSGSSIIPHPKRFKIKNLDSNITETGQNMMCLKPEKLFQIFSVTETSSKFPNNCAIGMINTGLINSLGAASDPEKQPYYCIACELMYKPVFISTTDNTTHRNGIEKCERYDAKCESSTWFNACSKCRAGSIYKIDSTLGIIDYSLCESFSDQNCYAFYEQSNEKICIFCKKGFSFNIDQICERINAPRCSDSKMKFNNQLVFKKGQSQYQYGIRQMFNGPGCDECESSYVPIYASEKQEYCTYSDYIKNGVYQTNTKLINNCLYYTKLDDSLLCMECQSSFTTSTDGKCYASQTNLNCIYFNGQDQCKICRNGFAQIGGNCEKKSISNCLIYNEGLSQVTLKCIQCQPEYYLSTDSKNCLKGNVKFCQILQSQNKCQKCNSGYQKVVTKDQIDYCFKLEQTLNCEEVDGNFFLENNINCLRCNQGYYLTTNIELYDKSICMKISEIQNCKKYDIVRKFMNQSTLKCKECSQLYFIDEGICKERVSSKNIDGCVQKVLNQDKCQKCQEQRFLSEDQLKCIEYPNGIENCSEYSDKETCTQCINNTYLSANKCLAVDEKSIKQNCLLYHQKGEKAECKTCKENYVQQSGECVASEALNCKTYESKIACATCHFNYGLKQENLVTNCIEKQVPFCQISNNIYPFKCTLCKQNYYPDGDGNCQEVSQIVKQCEIYKDDGICLKCNTNFTLNLDQKSCITNDFIKRQLQQKCKYSSIQQPKCSICKFGYFKNQSGECVACETSNESCLQCDNSSPQRCIMCRTNYKMDNKGNCQSIVQQTSISPLDTKFVSIWDFLVILNLLI